MRIQVREESISALPDYSELPQRLTVRERFIVVPIGDGTWGLALELETVAPPFVKDYDRDNGHGPQGWAAQWDLSNWGVLAAFDGPIRIGGALIAWDTPGIQILDGNVDRALLWDIQVHEDCQRKGVGSALFSAAVQWAKAKGCKSMMAETQNINVPACHFYESQGCRLASIDPFAYPDHPEEVRLVFRLELRDRDG